MVLVEGEQGVLQSQPTGSFQGFLSKAAHKSAIDCSVVDMRELHPRQKSSTMPWWHMEVLFCMRFVLLFVLSVWPFSARQNT